MKNPIRPFNSQRKKQPGIIIKENDWQIEYKVPDSHFIRFSPYRTKLTELRKKYPGIAFYGVRIIWKPGTPSPGYVQWTIRPYVQGMGCDGTTDGPIHLIAKTFVKRKGGNYIEIYKKAYGTEKNYSWITNLEKEHGAETIIPSNIDYKLMLYDLNDINNRSLVEELERKYGDVDW